MSNPPVMSPSRPRVLLVAALLLAMALPAIPSGAATITDVHYVPTDLPDGTSALIRVEVSRDDAFDAQGQGVLGSISPYNLTPTGNVVGGPSLDGIASAAIDVLGTRGSTGCWDYGGFNEMKAAVDAVRFLAGDIPDVDGATLDWANGRVGLTGVSYDGTTANMVAAAPAAMWEDSLDADGTTPLKAIVPVAAISHWYGYAYSNGVRFLLNSEVPTDEGFDTPLAFDLGFGLTVHTDQPQAAAERGCGTVEHTQQAYSRNPDYTDFWVERDYAATAADWTTNALIVHGWNDYNVKQYEATRLYEALAPHATSTDPVTGEVTEHFDLRLWMTQDPHANGSGTGYTTMRDSFLRAHLLEGDAAAAAAAAIADFPKVRSMAQTTDGDGQVTWSDTWPPAGTSTHTLFLNRTYEQDLRDNGVPLDVPGPGTGEVGELSDTNRWDGPLTGRSGSYGVSSGWLDTGASTEEVSRNDPWSNDGQALGVLGGQGYYSLAFSTTPLLRDVRIAGSAVLDGYFANVSGLYGGTHLTPVLVDIEPDGTMHTIQRGFLNTDYREGLEEAVGPQLGMFHAEVEMLPEDYEVPEGNRIGVILQSSNTVWAVPGNPAGFVNVLLGDEGFDGTRLHLPLVDVADGEQVFADWE